LKFIFQEFLFVLTTITNTSYMSLYFWLVTPHDISQSNTSLSLTFCQIVDNIWQPHSVLAL